MFRVDLGMKFRYVCDEGLARFCTRKYAVPTARNMSERTMHLANYSVTLSAGSVVLALCSAGSKQRWLLSSFGS